MPLDDIMWSNYIRLWFAGLQAPEAVELSARRAESGWEIFVLKREFQGHFRAACKNGFIFYNLIRVFKSFLKIERDAPALVVLGSSFYQFDFEVHSLTGCLSRLCRRYQVCTTLHKHSASKLFPAFAVAFQNYYLVPAWSLIRHLFFSSLRRVYDVAWLGLIETWLNCCSAG